MKKGKKSNTNGQEVNVGTKRTCNADGQEKQNYSKSRTDS